MEERQNKVMLLELSWQEAATCCWQALTWKGRLQRKNMEACSVKERSLEWKEKAEEEESHFSEESKHT